MNRFLDQVFFDNMIRDYLWVLGVIVFVLLLKRIISRYIAVLLCRLFSRWWKTLDQKRLQGLIIQPLGVFLVITVSIVALYQLNFPAALNVSLYKYPLQRFLLSLGIAIQIIAFIWLLLRIIDFIAGILETRANRTPDQNDNQLVVFFRDFIKVITVIIGFVMVLHFAFNYNVGSLLTGLSIVGAAIALSLRESLENLIASFVIFFDKPFTTGDNIKIQNISGVVERIGLRSTRVRTTDKTFVTVPNKQMVDTILDNVSLRSQIRGEINLWIELQTPPGRIDQLITEVKAYLSTVPEIQTFNVLFNDIRLQGYLVFVEFYTPPLPWNQFTSIRQGVNFFTLQTMERLEIKIHTEAKDKAR